MAHVTTDRVQGTVIRLVGVRGFGFVRASDGTECFFHRSACIGVDYDALIPGAVVAFRLGTSPKGPRAEDITAR